MYNRVPEEKRFSGENNGKQKIQKYDSSTITVNNELYTKWEMIDDKNLVYNLFPFC